MFKELRKKLIFYAVFSDFGIENIKNLVVNRKTLIFAGLFSRR